MGKDTNKYQGWIKLQRKLLDNPIFNNEKALKVWIWCLLKANHERKEFLIGRQKLLIRSGQFIFGSNVAKEQLRMSKSTIQFYLKYFSKVERCIERQVTNRYSIITICNWSEYQNVERKIRHLRNANETPNETNNNDNNDKENNIKQLRYDKSYLLQVPLTDLQVFTNTYRVTEAEVKQKAEELFHYCESKGKPYKNYKSLLAGALLRDFGKRDTGYSQAGYKIVRKKL